MTSPGACANCGDTLAGDVFNLDTRLAHTIRPRIFTPGQVALYYHAFVFLVFSLLFVARRLAPSLPGFVDIPIALLLFGWLFAYLPIALRRVYGGSRGLTAAKLVALGSSISSRSGPRCRS